MPQEYRQYLPTVIILCHFQHSPAAFFVSFWLRLRRRWCWKPTPVENSSKFWVCGAPEIILAPPKPAKTTVLALWGDFLGQNHKKKLHINKPFSPCSSAEEFFLLGGEPPRIPWGGGVYSGQKLWSTKILVNDQDFTTHQSLDFFSLASRASRLEEIGGSGRIFTSQVWTSLD